MRCPKCHYLSFEPEARCRNCGYDLALAEDDLIIKAVDDEDEGPLQDFDLRAEPSVPMAAPITLGPLHLQAAGARETATAVAIAPATPPAPSVPVSRPVRPPSTTTELPLFMRASATADPEVQTPLLVPVPASPRPPLSVRRRTEVAPEPIRFERTSMNDVAANLESVWAPLPPTVGGDAVDGERDATNAADDDPPHAWEREARSAETGVVTARERLVAAGIDLALLGGIDLIVVSLTLRICALAFGDVLTLPLVPLIAFFVLLDAGYLLLFTAASGQTLGKMATHIRVVDSTNDWNDSIDSHAAHGAPESLSLRQAVIRSIVTVPSVLALGAGFLPALGGGGLAIHDRIAHTRVVRA